MKLYSLNCILQIESSNKKYEEKFMLNVPGDTDRDARDKFLTGINNSKFFISPAGTFWPMFYTRAMIVSSSEFGSEPKTKIEPPPPPIEKKVRKPKEVKINQTNKPVKKAKKVKIQQGIKPRKTRSKKI